MGRLCGLYVALLPDGKIKRDLTTVSGEASLAVTSIEDEIIGFSELAFGAYAHVVDEMMRAAEKLSVEGRMEEVDMEKFQFIQDLMNDVVAYMFTTRRQKSSPFWQNLCISNSRSMRF